MRSLWIHGWASDSRVFGPLLNSLPPDLASGAEAPDIPGYGPGAKQPGAIPCQEWLIRKLADSSRNGPVTLGGWSLGAMLALEAAASRPDTVSSLVLISGCARFVRDPDTPLGQDPRAVRAMQLGLRRSGAKVVADFLQTLFSSSEQPGAKTFELQCGQSFTKINPAALSDGLNYLLTAGLEDRLERIACPVLLIHGSSDTVIDIRLAEKLADSLPDARLEVLDGAGHAPLWSQSGECARLVTEFIESRG